MLLLTYVNNGKRHWYLHKYLAANLKILINNGILLYSWKTSKRRPCITVVEILGAR